MNSKLIRHKLELHSPEWYSHRLNYIGGSEIGSVMGLSPYSCASRVFSEKIQVLEPWKMGNRHTFFGIQMEEIIANAWKYYSPTGEEDNYVQNHRENKVIRNLKNVGGYLINPKFPWLSVSLDRVINKNQFKMNGEVLNEEGVLELKTIDSMELAKWESLPTYYLAQITAQMVVTECKYSEMVLFDSRKNLHVYPVEYNKEFADQILSITKDFWYTRVLPAKELITKLKASDDELERSDLQHQINQLEPPADSSPAYEQFIKDKYKDGYVKSEKAGTMDDFELAVDYIKMNDEIKKLGSQQQLYKNQLLSSLGEHEYLSFDDSGYVSNTANKNGVRNFRVKIK